jgi:hypothetical protein
MVSLKFTLLSLVAVVCAVPGCSPGPSTFGLQIIAELPDGTKQYDCDPPGNAHGGSWTRLDRKATSAEKIGAFPHLFLEQHQNGEGTPYELYVWAVSGYVAGTAVPADRVALKAAVYDEAFGRAGKTDSFVVVFENKSYAIQVKGLPGSATECPDLPKEPPPVEKEEK